MVKEVYNSGRQNNLYGKTICCIVTVVKLGWLNREKTLSCKVIK